MTRERSPYEVLGLSAGADREAVEAAYRRLIKQHHPDRAGGDGEAAKTIIHAYRILKEANVPVVVEPPPEIGRRSSSRGLTLIGVVLAGLLWWFPLPDLRSGPVVPPPAGVPQPVSPVELRVSNLQLARVTPDLAAVEAGVEEAVRLAPQLPELAIDYSRSCTADLKRLPGDGLLDHCLAFDMAVNQGREAAGWWAGAPMAARHEEAAIAVLEDRVLAQARVREIRRLVERQMLGGPGRAIR